MRTRLQLSTRALGVGLVVNAILAAVKMTAGITGHSNALIADGIESFSDIVTSLVVWHAMVVSMRPADARHPYGHGRAETLAVVTVSMVLMAAALIILMRSISEIRTPHHAPAPYTLIVLLGVVLVKEGLFRFVARVGGSIESGAVVADAWHHRSDAITSAAAAVGISVALIGGKGFEPADDWAAIFAAGIIAWNAIRLVRPAVDELMDAAPTTDVVEQARVLALQVPGVLGVEKCLARKLGYGHVLDMHIEVHGAMSVNEAHMLAHAVEDQICAQLPRINEVTIHIEPHPPAADDKKSPAPSA